MRGTICVVLTLDSALHMSEMYLLTCVHWTGPHRKADCVSVNPVKKSMALKL